jgi:hypothetical protein
MQKKKKKKKSCANAPHQSFAVGWISIAGWLVIVTVQGYFGGMSTCLDGMARALEVGHCVNELSTSPVHLCSSSYCIQWNVRNHGCEDLRHLLGHSNIHHGGQHLGQPHLGQVE